MDDNMFRVSFPIDLVKREERIVTGVATADNIDKSGDIVEFDATLKAFDDWLGNIREMHAPVAVGKSVGFEPVNLDFDGKSHKGMKLSAFISKGAQPTWEKILDGTLSAFSIGGRILERKRDEQLSKELGRPVSRISKYELGEVSLVDNPANPAAVVELVKSNDDGQPYYALEIDESMNENDNGLQKNENHDNVHIVGEELVMDDFGVSDDLSVQEKVSLLRKFVNWLHSDLDDDVTFASDNLLKADEPDVIDSEGENEMDIETMKEAFSAVIDEKLPVMREELKSDITTYVDEKFETVEKNAETEEEEVVEAEVEVETDSETVIIDETVAKFREELDAALATIEEQKTALSDATAKIEQLESAGAMKKSVESDDDIDEEDVAIEKSETSFWDNLYLPGGLITSLGYDS
jgi:hypothetical protein|tara:strand:+ start:4678 stop:5904 length:1227 start_codon:yes stop_codon:yes gene_type:complete